MRLIFMGSPDFASAALASIHAAGHEILAVFSQPPKPKGRGQELAQTAVHAMAERLGIPVHTPRSLKGDEAQEHLRTLLPDIIIVAAYGLLLPKSVLEIPPLGCLNIHASLLPRWRGAAPIQHAILAGDTQTGITIMQMDEGLDTGPMLMKREIPILSSTTATYLFENLSTLGADLILEALEKIKTGDRKTEAQDNALSTYAPKITKEDGRIEWNKSASEIHRRIRALNPWPGVFAEYAAERIKVIEAEYSDAPHNAEPGTILKNYGIACGQGILYPTLLQRSGKKPMALSELLNGFPMKEGSRWNNATL